VAAVRLAGDRHVECSVCAINLQRMLTAMHGCAATMSFHFLGEQRSDLSR